MRRWHSRCPAVGHYIDAEADNFWGVETFVRAWLVAKGFSWMTPWTKLATISIIAVGLVGASVGLTGT